MNRWQQAWERVRRVDSPALGPVLDSFHILARGRHAGRATVGAGGENHLCTARRCAVYENGFAGVEPPLPLLSRTGELPLEAFAEQITRCGYRGPWSLEIFNDGFRASPNGATAKDGYRSLLWLEEQTRRRLPTCDADLFSPPPLPVYHGLEFIEFAASAAEAQRAWATSAGAGFSARGKPPLQTGDAVAQRRARIVINHQPHSWADHFINATGYRSARWRCGSSTARRLSPAPARWGMPPGRATPGRTKRRSRRSAPRRQPYLSHRRREAIYERDFHLRDGVTVREDYLGIDHLALGMEADSRDNWVMFFRTVFGFPLSMSRRCRTRMDWCAAWRCAARRAISVWR